MSTTERLELPPRLDHEGTRQLHARLTLSRGRGVHLEAGKVVYLGALALQVLLAAARRWRDDGQPFTLAQPSPAFADDLARLGADLSDLNEDQQP